MSSLCLLLVTCLRNIISNDSDRYNRCLVGSCLRNHRPFSCVDLLRPRWGWYAFGSLHVRCSQSLYLFWRPFSTVICKFENCWLAFPFCVDSVGKLGIPLSSRLVWQANVHHTEPRRSLGTWLREFSTCSCLAFLPGPAWVLLSKICKDFFSTLYIPL